MLYKRETLQAHNTIVKSGNGSMLDIVFPPITDPITGISGTSLIVPAYFVQAQYTTQDLSDTTIASGLTKLLISPLDVNGKRIPDFASMLKNKKAYVRLLEDNAKISIKVAKIVMPDNVSPILARVFIGG